MPVTRWMDKSKPVMTRGEAEEFFETQGKYITKKGRTLDDYMNNYIYSYGNDPIRGKNLMVMKSVLDNKVSDVDKERIGKSEVDKQKRQVIGQVLEQKGVPATASTGPLKNILEYADINRPAKGTGRRKRKSNKTRKNGRRTLKRKGQH